MISEDTKILKTGEVKGTLKYISDFTDFSNIEDERSGHFFPVILGDQYKEKTIKVTGNKEKEAKETEWVLRVNDNQSTFKFECENEPILTLSFPNAKLEPKPVAYSAKSKAVRKTATKKSVNTDSV